MRIEIETKPSIKSILEMFQIAEYKAMKHNQNVELTLEDVRKIIVVLATKGAVDEIMENLREIQEGRF